MAEGNAGGGGYLILYTTEPDSVNEARLTLEPDAGGHLRGILSIDLGAISDEVNFRWALVGGGTMAFTAETETLGSTADEVGEVVTRSPKTPPASSGVRDCESGQLSSDTQSVFLGGLNSARLLGTDGVENTTVGAFVTSVRFPKIAQAVDGDTYGWNLAIGKPGDKDAVRMGMLSVNLFEDCIDLTGGADVQDVTKLRATDMRWTVGLSGAGQNDPLFLTNPPTQKTGYAEWSFTDNTQLEAVFTDRMRADLRQAALFAAGSLAGVASGILVLGLFQAPSSSHSLPRNRGGAQEEVTRRRPQRHNRSVGGAARVTDNP